MKITLPWPPSVNHYWRHVGPRVVLSREGRTYRTTVAGVVLVYRHQAYRVWPLWGELEVQIDAYPPDLRQRDVDNIAKSCLDALQHAGAYANDYAIRKLTIERHHPLRKAGMVVVTIKQVDSTTKGEPCK